MRVLLVQPVALLQPGHSPYCHEVALLGAELARRGWTVGLALFRRFDEAALAAAVAESRPDVFLLYLESLTADLAFRLAEALRTQRSAGLILFGPYARRCPNEALSRAGVEAVATGPADATVPAYLEQPGESPGRLQARGMWINCATGVMRNPPALPPASLKDQPPPARELYGLEPLLDLAGFAEVSVSRGGGTGARGAGQAAVEQAPALPPSAPQAWPVLHRPVESVLREMADLAGIHLDLVGFRITNSRWTAAPWWLRDFAGRYAREVGLPLRTTLHAPDVTAEVAARLAEAGCEEVRINVGSGSALIRNDILGIDAPAEALASALSLLARAGIRTAARVEVGAAYETAVTLDETLQLLRRLDPDRVEAVLHYPQPGTPAHDAALENGLLVADPAGAHLAGRPALALPGLTEEELITAREALPFAVHRPRTAALIRWTRRVKMGEGRTLYEVVLKPLLGPPVRKRRKP